MKFLSDPEGEYTRFRRFFFLVGFAWTAVLIGLLVWNIHQIRRTTEVIAFNTARAHFNKDQAFRFWGSSHGGVYVPVTDRTPPNPNLAHVLERDLETPSGKRLTLMNSAYMVRQMNEDYSALYNVVGRITSLKPLRPENAPDVWEQAALRAFERKITEVTEFTEMNGQPYLRLMRPMVAQEGCLKCHGHQGYRVGDVRGGVGVSYPMASLLLHQHRQTASNVLSFGLVWLIGMVGLILASSSLLTHIRKHDIAEKELEAHRMKVIEADRLKVLGEMAAGVAHELNQPLTAISSIAEGFCLRFENCVAVTPEQIRGGLEDQLRLVGRMVGIIDHMRVFARDTSDEDAVLFNPSDVIHDVLKFVREQLRSHGIKLDLDIADALPECRGWPNEIEEVLLNLISNARDALEYRMVREKSRQDSFDWEPRLTIRVDTADHARTIRLVVSDNGDGISEGALPKVFDPFFTTKEVGKGTGL